MLEGEVVQHRYAGHVRVQRGEAVGAEEGRRAVPGQPQGHRAFKPGHEQKRMPGRRAQHVRHHVGAQQVARIVCPVKQEVERHRRVLGHEVAQRFKREAANAFQVPARQQKTGIDGDVHRLN